MSNEKTSAELVERFVDMGWTITAEGEARLRKHIAHILAAHRRECVEQIEAECKAREEHAYTAGHEDGYYKCQNEPRPGDTADPDKADTCGNCGALAWQLSCDSVSENRMCSHCGQLERNSRGKWVVAIQGKFGSDSDRECAHTEGEER